MSTLILQRLTTGEEGTFGTLTIPGDGGDDDVVFQTGELPWAENADSISCIPSGQYECRWTRSDRFSRMRGKDVFMFQVMDVPGRSGIRFHSGNFCGSVADGWVTHVEGCILLGRAKGSLLKNGKEQCAVTASVSAIEAFEEIMREQPFRLDVIDIPGEEWRA